MDISTLLTAGGAAVVTSLLVEGAKRAVGMTAAAVDRFGPVMAYGIGVVVVEAADAAAAFPVHPLQAALTGVLAGAASIGLYKTVS